MKIENYKKRIADKKIEHYLKLFGAISIEGPKYCGKTWAGRYHSNSEILLQKTTGETSNNVELAKIYPSIILEGAKPRLIDEWQEATNLWDEIRVDVDKTGIKGQYILTGSSTPNRKGIAHSGAGRYGKIQLRTMSLYESGDFTGDISLEKLCNNDFKAKATREVDLRNLAKLIIRGGWPANLDYSAKDSNEAIEEYINLIIDDDLNTFGFLFEALVERDLKIYADSFNAKCYHYQDYQDKEIDSVIELENGDWCAFEIKLGAHQIEKAANDLLNLKKQIESENGKAPTVLCVICGLTNAAYQRPDGVYVVPITALKN